MPLSVSRRSGPTGGVELELLVVVGHGEIDVPQVGDQSFSVMVILQSEYGVCRVPGSGRGC